MSVQFSTDNFSHSIEIAPNWDNSKIVCSVKWNNRTIVSSARATISEALNCAFSEFQSTAYKCGAPRNNPIINLVFFQNIEFYINGSIG